MWTRPSLSSSERRATRLNIQKSVQHFKSAEAGQSFVLQSWQAQADEQRQLIFFHGALGHGSRYQDMFEWLIRRFQGKLTIHAIDFVGHGLSTGTRAYISHFQHWIEDALKVYEHLSSRGPVTVMGHSMGGLIALKTVLENEVKVSKKIDSLVLCNPCIRPQQVVDFPHVETAFNAMADHFPLFRYPRIYKGPDLMNDAQMANGFETDPLIPAFITSQMAREVWYASQQVRPLSYYLNRPALFLVSDKDVVVDREATLLFTRGIDKHWAKIVEYQNVKHELLHESIRHQVWTDVATWLENL